MFVQTVNKSSRVSFTKQKKFNESCRNKALLIIKVFKPICQFFIKGKNSF